MSVDIEDDYIKNNNMKYTCDRRPYAMISFEVYL